MIILKKIAVSIVISGFIYIAISVTLILSQWPGKTISSDGLDFSDQIKSSTATPMALTTFKRRDGSDQMARVYPGPTDGPMLVMVHGSGWHGLQFDQLARRLQGVAAIVAPDLRGHGEAPVRRGDIDYIGQLEDDLADLIKSTAKPGQKVILGGHSSGGGLVVRFAGGQHRELINGAILLAPFLKHNAPTTRPASGGWAQVLTRRIIGLSMLNNIGITALNKLTIIEFNFPESVRSGPLGHTITDAYSYRLNTAFAPRNDYLNDVAQLPEFLLVAGLEDESFVAKGYENLMAEVSDKGTYLLVDGIGHLAIVDAPETTKAMLEFLK